VWRHSTTKVTPNMRLFSISTPAQTFAPEQEYKFTCVIDCKRKNAGRNSAQVIGACGTGIRRMWL
jgi:hypothetical protein